MTQAALPILREQGSGHIMQVSSIGGISAFPSVGIYHASKWALEGFSQALAQEVAGFGIHVTLVEPGGFSTDWARPVGPSTPSRSPAYDEVRDAGVASSARARQRARRPDGLGRGGPARSSTPSEPPLRVFFGSAPLGIAKADYESRLATWREWQPVAELAQG